MADDLVLRARRGDLTGLNLAGLVRLSPGSNNRYGDDLAEGQRPFSGQDIKSTDEQEKDTRLYTTRRGGSYVHTYREPDTSAWRRRRVVQPDGTTAYRVIRPVFEGALNDLKRGVAPNGERLDGLVVYDIDRLTRDNRHLEDAIEVVQHYGRPILDYTDTLDLLTENGRTIARILVATSAKQSADTSRRVKRKHEALQQAGIPGGGPRPFGWVADRRTADPKESAAIRDAAQRILAGAPLPAIVADWNAAGLTTTRGGPWTKQSLKRVLRNPRLAGYRARGTTTFDSVTGSDGEFRMEKVLDEDGHPVMGQWEPLLSASEWESLTALIDVHSRAGRGTNARSYLLSGITRCGRCGSGMRALKPAKSRPDSVFSYLCESPANGGCSGVGISGPKTDEYITELVIQMYEREAAARDQAVDRGPWPRQEELDELRRDIVELTRGWRATPKLVSSARYFALLPDMEATEHSLATEREAWLAAGAVAAGVPASIRADWSGYPLVQKRAYIQDMLSAVVVNPLPAGAQRRFNPDRLDPIPAGRPE
jgi:site-specific DNA recombinase